MTRLSCISFSPRPVGDELLSQIGVPFQVLSVDVDESVAAGGSPARYVSRIAAAKADAGLTHREAAQLAVRPVLPRRPRS